MITRKYKVYGYDGHRQRVSFEDSVCYDFSRGDDVRIIELENFDKTGTHDYTIMTITRNTADEVYNEMVGQVLDGAFENSRVGKVVQVDDEDEVEIALEC